MYLFLLNSWKLRRVDDVYLQLRVGKGQITQAEYNTIINTPQV